MKYSRSLDLVLASLREATAGKMETAAKAFELALKQRDLLATIAMLEARQVTAFAALQEANPTIASMFATLAAKKKKAKAKAAPFGGKKAPPFKKKKVKASEDTDSDEESTMATDELDPVLDEMTADDMGDEGLSLDGDDLTLEDLDGLDDGVAEMPEATAAESDDDEEESSDEEDTDEDEEESSPAATTAKVKVVTANVAALERLQKTLKRKTTAGTKKPAGK